MGGKCFGEETSAGGNGLGGKRLSSFYKDNSSNNQLILIYNTLACVLLLSLVYVHKHMLSCILLDITDINIQVTWINQH